VTTAPSDRRLPAWLLPVAGLVFAVVAFYLSFLLGIEDSDESWFLQLTLRVASGETLYRDVFFSTTPLPVYLTAGFASLFGHELLVHKALTALLSALIVLLIWLIAHQFAALGTASRSLPEQALASRTRPAQLTARRVPFMLLLGVFVYGIPWKVTTTPLATMFFLACQAAALAFLGTERQAQGAGSRRSYAYLMLAGAAAGLSFCSKQNYGLVALGALIVCAWVGSRSALGRRRLLMLAVVLAAFAAVTVLVHVPVCLSGGLPGLVDYGFTNKVEYVRFSSVSYFDGIQWFWNSLHWAFSTPRLAKSLRGVYWGLPFLFPFVAFPSLVLAYFAAPKDRRAFCVAAMLFMAAGFVCIFPLCDRVHLYFVTPHLLLGLSCAAQTRPLSWLRGRWRLAGRTFLFAWLGLGLGLKIVPPTLALLAGEQSLSSLPHYRGTPVTPAYDRLWKRSAERLAGAAGGRSVFLLSPRAGFLYLTSGVRNPTPFDYPIITCLGSDGERKVTQSIADGEIDVIGVDRSWRELKPKSLIGYVERNLTKTDDLGFLAFYRR
jgi:4-amino-4-deoxy-L-arabinose transferase-like glycosyltransferase